MTGKSNLAEMYSTLQLVKHDQTANAAEVDRDVNAPERDQTLATPQVCFLIVFSTLGVVLLMIEE